MWKTASASRSTSPPSGGRPRLVADHTHKEPCTKIARAGTCSFLPISQLRVVSLSGREGVGAGRVQVAHPQHRPPLRAGACTLNAVGLPPVSGRGDARVAPPCPTTLIFVCVQTFTLPYLDE